MSEKVNPRVVLTKRLLQEGLMRLLEKKELSKHITRNMDFDIPDVLEKLSRGRNGMNFS